MRYVILTNPASGRMSADQKRKALQGAAAILDADIQGLDIQTREGFVERARQLEKDYDVMVVAGGDGTFSDVINAIDTSRKPVAYLPLGSGNAMRHGLEYRGSLAHTAQRIRDGEVRAFDLLECNGRRRAVTAAIGIEGAILRIRDQLLSQGTTGFRAYLEAVMAAYFKSYERTYAEVIMDGVTLSVPRLLTLIITKQPYYGYRMNVVPMARFDDGMLHGLWVSSGFWGSLFGALTAFTIGNRSGQYRRGEKLVVRLQKPLLLHTDGNLAWEADRFQFAVLPKALKIKC